MSFKNLTLALICTLVSMNSFAAGCQSLKNSDWTGQITLTSGSTVTLNLHISDVIPMTDDQFKLTGTINDEPLSTNIGCIEQAKDSIRSILIGTTKTYLTTHTLSPDHQNPTLLNSLTGNYHSIAVAAVTSSTTNYLTRA